jgi:hypothetical protein
MLVVSKAVREAYRKFLSRQTVTEQNICQKWLIARSTVPMAILISLVYLQLELLPVSLMCDHAL